jgi:hypothetical protein
MTELTPERLRDAADVVLSLGWLDEGQVLLTQADEMERDRTAKAKRDKRIEELADEAICAVWPDDLFPPIGHMKVIKQAVAHLVDRHPSFLND